MLEALRDRWRNWRKDRKAQQLAAMRRVDIDILWPQLLATSGSLEKARTAFLMHMMMDRAWSDVSTHDMLQVSEDLAQMAGAKKVGNG